MRIGIDVGGVLSVKTGDYEEEKDADIDLLNVPGCFNGLQALKAAGHELYIISFCGRKRAANTRKKLSHKGLFTEMYFVKNKVTKHLISSVIGLDVFIDDTMEVIQTFITILPSTHLIHFIGDMNEKKAQKSLKCKSIQLTTHDDWEEMTEYILQLCSLHKTPDHTTNISHLCY